MTLSASYTPRRRLTRHVTRQALLTWMGAVTLVGALSGCGDSDEAQTLDPDNTPPNAVLTLPERVEVGQAVLLDATASDDAEGELLEYWFQPGQEEPILQSVSPTLFHTFENPGTFTVTLTVLDAAGTKATDRREVVVE